MIVRALSPQGPLHEKRKQNTPHINHSKRESDTNTSKVNVSAFPKPHIITCIFFIRETSVPPTVVLRPAARASLAGFVATPVPGHQYQPSCPNLWWWDPRSCFNWLSKGILMPIKVWEPPQTTFIECLFAVSFCAGPWSWSWVELGTVSVFDGWTLTCKRKLL